VIEPPIERFGVSDRRVWPIPFVQSGDVTEASNQNPKNGGFLRGAKNG
jgi:hypothetical protein